MTSHTSPALSILGGRPLEGTTYVHGAKNSALYLLLASLLTQDTVELRNVPALADVSVSLDILEHLGVRVHRGDGALSLTAEHVTSHHAPFRLVGRMRASFVTMGPLLARMGRARIGVPGGCAFGPRPVDRHLRAFEALGATVHEHEGDYVVERHGPLEGHVVFEEPTVGGTQNVLLASALGSRRVVVENAALEPEVTDLADLLRAMGARIEGAGTSVITVHGVERLHGTTFSPIPDRIEAGTLLMAAAATRGTITLQRVRPQHVAAVLDVLRATGTWIEVDDDAVSIDARGPLHAVDVTAVPYPGFPTDLQAPLGAFLATVPGISHVRDDVYPGRFTHVPELVKMGARARLDGRTLEIRGGALTAADVHGADLRASGALVVAALAAQGTSTVRGLDALDRGYVDLVPRLTSIGARLERIEQASVAPRPSLDARARELERDVERDGDPLAGQEGKRTVRA